MARCPNCKAEIDRLVFEETKIYSGTIEVVNRQVSTDTEHSDTGTHFDCPRCNVEVATEETVAVSILKGEYDG